MPAKSLVFQLLLFENTAESNFWGDSRFALSFCYFLFLFFFFTFFSLLERAQKRLVQVY
jgi:hypothetical protein